MRILGKILGVLLCLIGCVWFMQGVGVLPGSVMSGQSKWAINGAIAVVVGIVLLWVTWGRGGPGHAA